MTGQFPGSRAETSDTLSGAMGLVVFVSVGAFVQPQSRPAGKGSSNERPESLRVFGRLPVIGARACTEAGVRKASREETAGGVCVGGAVGLWGFSARV